MTGSFLLLKRRKTFPSIGQTAETDRHKRKAWLGLELFGRKVETQVGLEIAEKR